MLLPLQLQTNEIITFFGLSLGMNLILLSIRLVLKRTKGIYFPAKGLENILVNYHILILPSIVALLMTALLVKSPAIILAFLVLGIWGMIGETLFSFLWQLFYQKPIWEYKVATLFRKYTSWLNPTLWAIGGMLFVLIARSMQFKLSVEIVLYGIVAFVALLTSRLLFVLMNKGRLSFRFVDINLANYLCAALAILVPIIILSFRQGVGALVAISIMGLVAFIAEYLAGKFLAKLLDVKFWVYSYWTWDDGHTTPTNIIPFMLAGLWFLAVVA